VGARVVAAADGRYLEVNEEALAILGRSEDEVLASVIGDFAGPYRELARTVWARLAGRGEAIPTGEASLYRPDGSAVRVEYTRITRREDGAYVLEITEVGPGGGPPRVNKPSLVLDQWRAIERERAAAGPDSDDGSDDAERTLDALRSLYQHGVTGQVQKPR
jgi:PAS domain S-box-containing protein